MHPYIAYLVLTSPARGTERPDEIVEPLPLFGDLFRHLVRLIGRLRQGK